MRLKVFFETIFEAFQVIFKGKTFNDLLSQGITDSIQKRKSQRKVRRGEECSGIKRPFLKAF